MLQKREKNIEVLKILLGLFKLDLNHLKNFKMQEPPVEIWINNVSFQYSMSFKSSLLKKNERKGPIL